MTGVELLERLGEERRMWQQQRHLEDRCRGCLKNATQDLMGSFQTSIHLCIKQCVHKGHGNRCS